MNQKLFRARLFELIPFASAGFTAALGLLVIAGWICHLPLIIQIDRSLVSMQFNTALCFLLFGTGFLSLLSGKRAIARVAGALVTVIAFLTFLEYVLGTGLGIDQLLMKAYITVKTPKPGRMAPNTSIGFTLSGIFLLFASLRAWTKRTGMCAGVAGALISGFGVIALWGYLSGAPEAYTWSGMKAMAVHTAVGLTVLGSGVIAHALQRADSEWLPIIAGIGGLFITLLLAQAMIMRENVFSSSSIRSTIDIAILVLVFVVFLLLSLALYFALKAGRNARKIFFYSKKLENEISERQLIEEELASAEAKYRTLIENIPAITYIAALDDSSSTHFISPQVEDILGYTQAEWMAAPDLWRKLLYPEDLDRVMEEVDSCRNNLLPFDSEYRMIAKNGTVVWLHDKALFVKDEEGNPLFLHGFMQDITMSRKAENDLLEQLHFQQSLIDAIPAWIYCKDTSGRYFGCNTAMSEFLGIPKEKIIGARVHDIFEKESAAMHHAVDEILLRSPGMQTYESRARQINGEWRDLVFYKATFNRKDGQLGGIVAVTLDITELKKALMALQESQRALATLMGNLPGMAYRCGNDRDWTMEFVSDGCLGLTGYGPEDLINNGRTSYGQIIHPDDRASVWDEVQSAVREKRNYELSYRIITDSGDLKWVWEKGSGVYSSDGGLIALEGFISDVTEHKNLELQLRHAQKMEAIGVLSGGIAHDFNNIINVIMGFASLMETEMEKQSPMYAYLHQILTAAERASKLTKSLLAFGRKQAMELRPIDLNEILARMRKLLQILVREDTELKISVSDEELFVMADSGQMEQVLVNLTTNAIDAMRFGGTLSIGTMPVELDRDYISRHGYGKPGRYALLALCDTGTGMDEATRQKIFEPFFTTKEVGKGTGLGLSIIYGIIKQHNGYITCFSEPGKGTTFEIYLPLIAGKPLTDGISAEPAMPRSGTETILLAEDDHQLRELTKNVLEGYGYTVIEAEDGENAVEKFAENMEKIQLSILDVIMPRKNGKEVYEEIFRIRPDSKVIFTSGYPEDIFDRDEILGMGLDFIAKPVLPSDLLKKIREVLDGNGNRNL